ncbi:methionyl-tRNA formyltransferase [Aquimarina brevivitae]|uniref:Methionyl-tRNA formyltransferase n=2 Tax=Aquimarina brevivitae TaxID=323412 RepID=A0A4Q7PES9_9FLAO|nr:methionyl-tRNA formyltransferase [Aquimarina brevivitae]
MKIILIGSDPSSLLVFNHLSEKGYLVGVCTESEEFKNNYFSTIETVDSFALNRSNIQSDFPNWLQTKNPDLILVCGLGLKLTKDILSIPKLGCFNIHFGKLPENRGPDPLFWSIKNGDPETAISIHQMDAGWDTGKIVISQTIPIILGETAGMLNSKMSYQLPDLMDKMLSKVKNELTSVEQSTKGKIQYNKRPIEQDITIDWENQNADDIERLINACNPKYGGATTYYQGAKIKILEVSPVENQTPLFGRTPGEIVHAHPQEGLFICCRYGQLLRLNVISTDAGILSGTKYVNLGLKPGQLFTTTNSVQQKSTIDNNY